MRHLNLFAHDSRDVEEDGVHGTLQGFLSIRYGWLQWHYTKEKWMTEEVSADELSKILADMYKENIHWYSEISQEKK